MTEGVTEREVQEVRAGGNAGFPPLATFLVVLGLLLVSVGGPVLLLGVSRAPAAETPTPRPLVTIAAGGGVATSAPVTGDAVRVLSATGTSTPEEGGNYRITITWTLEGAKENDTAALAIYAGNELLGGGVQEGVLDPNVFSFSTGEFRLELVVPCSTGGWTAALLEVRGMPVEGDGEAVIPGVSCG